MAVEFIEGFDHYLDKTSMLLNRWFSGASSSLAFVTGRSGTGQALALVNNGTGQNWVTRRFRASGSPLQQAIIGFAYKAVNFGNGDKSIIYIENIVSGNWECSLAYSGTGQMEVHRGNATQTLLAQTVSPVLTANTWHYIEFRVNVSTSGSFTVWVDGVQVLHDAGPVNTSQTGATGFHGTWFYASNTASHTKWLDDLYVLSSTTPIGQGTVQTLLPSANGAVTGIWTPNTGTAFGSAGSDDDDTSYIAASANADKQTFLLPDISSLVIPKAMEVVLKAKRSDANARTIAPTLRTQGGGDSVGTDAVLTAAYAHYGWLTEVGPGKSDPLTVDEVNTTEAGVIHQATGGGAAGEARVTQLAVQVLTVPAPAPVYAHSQVVGVA